MEIENYQTEIDENPINCPMCDGNDHKVLGVLGRKSEKLWLRCCSCGWNFATELISLYK